MAEVQWPLTLERNTTDLTALARQQVLDVTFTKTDFSVASTRRCSLGAGEHEFRLSKPQEGKQIPARRS